MTQELTLASSVFLINNNMHVKIRKNESIEAMLKRFSRKVKKEKIIEEYRERQQFKKPSEIKREKKAKRKAELEKLKRKEQRENERS
jgi:small subunit ribosomal protein S21